MVLLTACGDEPTTAPALTINIESVSIELGGSVQLSARNAQGTIVWTSSNQSVATVLSTGFVTAVSPGTATITATVGSQSASSVVTVLAPPAIGLASSSVAFSARAGSSNPAPQTVAITNAGPGTLQGLGIAEVRYGAGQPAGWLTASLSSATATAAQASSLQLSASVGGLTAGVYNATVVVSASVAANSPQEVAVTLTVTAPPTLVLSASTAQLSMVSGDATPASTTVSITSGAPAPALGLTATISYGEPAQSGWLTATLNAATTPATLTLQATAGARPAGTYTATVSIASTDATNSPRTLLVTFIIAPARRIDVSTTALAFGTFDPNLNPSAQQVQITNGGGGSLTGLSAAVQYTNGTGWLTATLNTTTAPATLTVQPVVAGLSAGTYNAVVRLTAPGAINSPRDIAITLVLSTQPTILVAPTSLAFSSSGAAPASQVVAVTNGGGGTLSGLSSSVQYTDGNGWLTATLNTTTAPASLTVQANPTGLAVGTYQATLRVQSALADNSPVSIPVTFTITAPPSIALSTESRAFQAVVGEPAPGTQTVTITNGGGGTLSGLSLNTVFLSGSGWLTATLNTTTAPATLSLTVDGTTLPVGVYNATVRISSGVASNSPRTVSVSLTVLTPLIGLGSTTVQISHGSGNGNAPAVGVSIINGGAGTLSGLNTAIINYAGPSPNTGWLTATLNTTTAPALLTLTANAGTPGAPRTPGVYTATVLVASPVAGDTPRQISVTFTVQVSLANNLFQQIYTPYCASCHSGAGGSSYPDLSTVAKFRNNMVGVFATGNTATYPLAAPPNRVIVAGNSSQSYLMYMLNKSAGARPMPIDAMITVPSPLRTLMATWITQGALNN